MQYLDRKEAVARMNRLSAAGAPFVFIVDYEARRALVFPVSEADPGECLFDFGGVTNSAGTRAVCTDGVRWDVETLSETEYRRSFDTVRRNLLAGNSYLTNLTCRVAVDTNLSLRDIYCRSSARYRLWLKDTLVCFSPETFVRIADGEISSYPMKGTISAAEPDAGRRLMDDAKETAEHATIVDLIRNDLSMVADGVRVRRYRYVERLETNRGPILQTSSEVCGSLPADWAGHVGDILFSQLPAGSITGAPKPATMRIIAEAENYGRGFYTGVMGWCDGRRLDSAVMIRFIDSCQGRMFFKAGGGVTARSRWQDEYKEVIQKIYVPIR